MVAAIFIIGLIIIIIVDVIIRLILKNIEEKKARMEREAVLNESLKIDFGTEAKSLKRAEVPNPKAKILCVDDEEIILDSFRKILVLDGYSVDTVQSGQEAINLIKNNHYDFVFTDLKMPEMDGVEVTKKVKYLRPDIDVVIITGYATVETAVATMKDGAMDYVQKPFTEDELLAFVKQILIKRQDRLMQQLKPRVHIAYLSENKELSRGEFAIPGGVFISDNHVWASIEQNGLVNIGLDDLAVKILGNIEDIGLPNIGLSVKVGDPLFSVKVGAKSITFKSPVSGRVLETNNDLLDSLDALKINAYDKNWLCKIDCENLDNELKDLKIGKSAVKLYQEDIEKCKKIVLETKTNDKGELQEELYIGVAEKIDDKYFYMLVADLFNKQ
jgi:CheY-like chemotaxis protein/glycine cleavage system H lipoate-binding protein